MRFVRARVVSRSLLHIVSLMHITVVLIASIAGEKPERHGRQICGILWWWRLRTHIFSGQTDYLRRHAALRHVPDVRPCGDVGSKIEVVATNCTSNDCNAIVIRRQSAVCCFVACIFVVASFVVSGVHTRALCVLGTDRLRKTWTWGNGSSTQRANTILAVGQARI